MDGYCMRFHDIPDLPIRAFLHNGIKGKICLYKGGGDIVEWASDQLDETPVFSNPGETFANIDDAVNDTIPGGWATVGAVAIAVTTGYIDPTLLGAEVGSEIGALASDAAIQGGLGAAETGIGSEIGALASDAAIQEGLNQGVAQLGAGTSLSADAATNPLNPFYSTANPTTAANLNTVSNLVGGGSEFNLGALDALANNPLLPVTGAGIGGAELGATGSIIGSGNGLGVNTLADTLAPTGLNGLTPVDLSSQPNFEPSTPSTTNAKDVADALRRANQLKNILTASNPTVSKTNVSQQPQALSNLLRANQFTPVEAPPIYKAQNPFSFGQQQPIQDTNQLASLLRNNYGNS